MIFSVVTNEPVEAQDLEKTTNLLSRFYKIHLKLIKKSRKITTCNQLELEIQGF